MFLNQQALNAVNAGYVQPTRLQEIKKQLSTQEYEGAKNTGGITWPGSQFTGPGNKLVDPVTKKSNFTELPKTPVDWVTMEHDVDYYNMKSPTIDSTWDVDKKAIEHAFALPDAYNTGEVTAVGLLAKNVFERTLQSITGSNVPTYPKANTSGHHIDWFDKVLSRRRILKDSEAGEGTSGGGSVSTVDTDNAERGQNYADSDVFADSDSEVYRAEDVIAADPDFFASHQVGSGNHMETNVPTGTKRGPTSEPADSSSAAKKPKESAGMDLPGTGGTSNSDPDTGNPSAENAVIPRPINNYGRHNIVFRKHHSLLSYGLAWKISRLTPAGDHYLTTTSLMSIPVELPFLYISPAEWNWLKDLRGVNVDHVSVKVIMRNPRTAFETNSSSTTLATLNQNKYLGTATGLNLSTRGLDRKMKFGSGTDAMCPTGTDEYDLGAMDDFVVAAYGARTQKPELNFEGFHHIPCSFLYLPFINNRYFCSVAAHDDVNKDIGWPDLTQYITKSDASFTTGKVVATYSYKPKVGLLTQPFQMRLNGYYGTKDDSAYKVDKLAMLSKNKMIRDNAIVSNIKTGETHSKTMHTIDIEKKEWDQLFERTNSAYYSPIDKSQYIKEGPWDCSQTSMQPSLHVGIFPVPRLTTSDLKIKPEKFTDVETQWDVQCEMHCSYGFGTMNLTHYDKPYLEPFESGHFVHKFDSVSKDTYFQTQYSTVNGEYVTRVLAGANSSSAHE